MTRTRVGSAGGSGATFDGTEKWAEDPTSRRHWSRRWLRALAVGMSLAAAASVLPAQQPGVVSGTVLSDRTSQPIAGAQVNIQGTELGAVTNADGRFRIANVPGTTQTLTVRRIGYRPVDEQVTVGAADIRIRLAERAIELSEVVVTGTAGAQERRAIGNAVSTVSAAELTATQPVQNLQQLITGRASGVSVISSSGQVGTGSRIRVRGASSLSLPNDPLIYVDGVRVDNAQATGPINQAFGARSVSRWNDFNPDDIESIEVIKGPAAATLYGTEASNGVIQIITKRGAEGRASWNFTARVGTNFVPNWRDGLFENWGVVPRAGTAGALDTVTITTRQLNDSLRANFGEDIFRRGLMQDMQLSVSGGSQALRYYVGGGYEENEGAERANSLRRTSLRANLALSPSDRWDVQTSMGYTTGRTNLPLEAGGGGATWATYFSSPAFLYSGTNPNNPQLGFRSGPPDIYYTAYQIFQDADRYTGSVTVTHRPLSWLDHRLIIGVDRMAEDNQERAPRNDVLGSTYSAFSTVGPTSRGYLEVWTRDATNTTFDWAGNARFNFTESIDGITSIGGQFYGRKVHNRQMFGRGFPAAGLISLNSAEIQTLGFDELLENNTVGGFIQQQVVFNDRLFLTAAVRTDDNSAFGTNFDAVTYPKFSASWVASEEPFVPLPEQVNTLRLRAAYGASGLQPGAFDAIRTYSPVGGQVTPASPGNPDLGPERSTELELGFDVGVFDDRFGAEVTYFDGVTKDAILSRLSPPSEGFSGLQFFNAGRVDRNGIEWLLRAQPLQRENISLDLTLTGSTHKYNIVSLGEDTDRVSLSSNIQHVVGHAPGAFWDRRVVSGTKVVNANGTVTITNQMCDDGEGGTVACASAPRVFLGNSVPTREGAFSAGLTFLRDFRVNAMFDWRGGYSKLDGNRRVRCNLFSLCRENYFAREDQYDAVMLAEVTGGTAYTYNITHDASFTRFRELAVSWTVPERFTRQTGAGRATLTVAGRNLALWSDYPGLDPEASFNSGTRGGYGFWEQNVLPQLRSIVTTLNLTF